MLYSKAPKNVRFKCLEEVSVAELNLECRNSWICVPNPSMKTPYFAASCVGHSSTAGASLQAAATTTATTATTYFILQLCVEKKLLSVLHISQIRIHIWSNRAGGFWSLTGDADAFTFFPGSLEFLIPSAEEISDDDDGDPMGGEFFWASKKTSTIKKGRARRGRRSPVGARS